MGKGPKVNEHVISSVCQFQLGSAQNVRNSVVISRKREMRYD